MSLFMTDGSSLPLRLNADLFGMEMTKEKNFKTCLNIFDRR